jgi:hypothetical protein
VPVFLLTDQHFLDSSYNIEKRDLVLPGEERHLVRTARITRATGSPLTAYRRAAFPLRGGYRARDKRRA